MAPLLEHSTDDETIIWDRFFANRTDSYGSRSVAVAVGATKHLRQGIAVAGAPTGVYYRFYRFTLSKERIAKGTRLDFLR